MWGYIIRRIIIFVPQILGVTFLVFVLVRLLPGDPAVRLAGGFATQENIDRVRAELDLDKSVFVQYWTYMGRLVRGDLGTSTFTSNSVASDLASRFPATMQLIGISLILGVALALFLGVYTAVHPNGKVSKGVFGYGMLSGGLPDFWLGLILIYIFFTVLGVAPVPVGQFDITMTAPPKTTGFSTVDSLLAGNFAAFRSAVGHLILPVMTLVFVYFGLVLKTTRSAMDEVLSSPWMRFAIASGISKKKVMRYGLRNVMPPVLTITGVVFLFLIGGAVLVENVFSWGGLGQYAVQALQASDYAAVQGFVLTAALLSLIVNLIIDILYFVVDPRIRVSS